MAASRTRNESRSLAFANQGRLHQSRDGVEESVNSKKRWARVAGLLYLVVAICGGWAQLFRQGLVVPGNAAATASNIAGSATLFRLAFFADLVNVTVTLLLAFALYQLLSSVSQKIAATFVILNAVAVAIMGANALNHLAALLVVSEPTYAAAFGTASSQALALFFMDLHTQGYLIAGIFFGLWLLPLGYLVYRSGYFPRVLGIVLMVGSFGYPIHAFVAPLLPSVGATVGPMADMMSALAEIAFVAWLLIKGTNVPGQNESVATQDANFEEAA